MEKILFIIYFQLILQIAMASVFVTHGGGPMPLIYKEEHKSMYQQFKEISGRYPNPRGIIIFSAHWEQSEWTMLDYDSPPLYYDYYGFPPQSYNLSFSMSSTSDLRNQIKQKLLEKGIQLKNNTKRGYDHGVFIPLMIMYPQSKIPVIQISLLKSLDPEAHFRMGVALRRLKNQGFLIIGSGASVHGGFMQKQSQKISKIWDDVLTRQIVEGSSQNELLNVAKNWKNLPHSSYLHPRQEHLIPLFVNLGLYEGKKKQNMKLFLMGVHLSSYLFQ